MRNDLLEADASVRWAESNLPPLEIRLSAWLKQNIRIHIKQTDGDGKNILVASHEADLPLTLNAEVGAYINAIRSSLDMLAVAVGKRHKVLFPDKIYFPIATSAEAFRNLDYKGAHLMRNLPCQERVLFESLNPYRGGNNALWTLHDLDIVRKHRRLLTVLVSPAKMHISGWGLRHYFTPVSTGFMRNIAERETVLGLIAKGRYQPKIDYTPHITIDEPGFVEGKPVTTVLRDFASLADSIIKLFDF